MFDEAGREILARLRGASRRGTASSIEAALEALPAGPQAELLDDRLPLAFLARVLGNGGSCEVVGSRQAVVGAIGAFVARRHGQRRVVAGFDPRLAALPWRDGGLLPRFGAAESGDPLAVSYARAAVAETGSVLLHLGRDNPASNNLLAEDHVVLVDADAIVRRLEEAWALAPARTGGAPPGAGPRGSMLISGPSSTADIGMQLVTGAHGPRCWHVIVVGAGLDPDLAERARSLAAAAGAARRG